ncbi:MAG: hypothetical protein IJC68_03825, partial [Firmicutes bacterium]|nr:hypothetical protein [Bacillota bacterium]
PTHCCRCRGGPSSPRACWLKRPEAAARRLLYLPVAAAEAEALLPVRGISLFAEGMLVEKA